MSEIPIYDDNESRPDSPVAGGANPIEDDTAVSRRVPADEEDEGGA